MTKRFVSFGLAVSAAGLIAAVFLPHGVLSHSSDQDRITVNASERGYPRINLRDGIELGDNVSSPGVSARAMAAGDFARTGQPTF